MPGSDQKINYQIRPAKSIERKMLCDLIREIQLLRSNGEMRYIGLGAKYFTDFLLLHNEFGITDMISIEAQKERQMRYEFNKPLKYIQMWYGSTNEVLPQLDNFDDKMNLIWLDYDSMFNETMLKDVETICKKLCVGSMFFLSCNCSFSGTQTDKMKAFKENVGEYFDESTEKKQYSANNIPYTIKSLIDKQIKNSIEMRKRINNDNLEYLQLLFLKYKDGAQMLTIGGVIVDEKLRNNIENSRLFNKYDFISINNNLYSIDIPQLTNKEIQLILKNLPISEEEYIINQDKFFGIEYDEIAKFQKIYRYYPFYSEGVYRT
ncbi:MAG: hypothetical protein IJ661_00595 [Lachnospiraceae bacterium]|nr:hypothetical protein [Lachnospiraceae bacterium]